MEPIIVLRGMGSNEKTKEKAFFYNSLEEALKKFGDVTNSRGRDDKKTWNSNELFLFLPTGFNRKDPRDKRLRASKGKVNPAPFFL